MQLRFGSYWVLGEIARGGMGVVYLAERELHGGARMRVALKLVSDDWRTNNLAEPFFIREINTLCAITDPNVVRIVDASVEADIPYIAMEYLQGVSLSDLRCQAATLAVALDPMLVISIVAQACRGLWALHRSGVVHRDVSPSNLFLTRDGHVKVIDLGTACSHVKSADEDPEPVIGKPRYMAPEAYDGARTPDPRADVFSLGIVLWELLSGIDLVPRDPRDAFAFVATIDDRPIAMPEAVSGRSLERTLRGTLRGDPERRTSDLSGVLEGLRAATRDYHAASFWDPEVIAEWLTSRGFSLTAGSVRPVATVTPSSSPVATSRWRGDGAVAFGDEVSAFFDARASLRADWMLCHDASAAPKPSHLHAAITDTLVPRNPALAGRLHAWADAWNRVAAAAEAPLVAITEAGPRPEGGAYFVAPRAETWAERGPLASSAAARLDAARALFGALARAVALDPDFVHGHLVAHNVAWSGGGAGAAVRLLPGDPRHAFALSRGGPLGPRAAARALPPEVLRGERWTHAADVFMAGALLYWMLRDERVDAGPADDGGARRPRPFPRPEATDPAVEMALFAALRPDPFQRPPAEALAAMLGGPPGVVPLDLPEGEEAVEAIAPTGHRVSHRLVSLADVVDARRLPWCDLPEVLPGGLILRVLEQGRSVRVEREEGPTVIYRRAPDKVADGRVVVLGRGPFDRFELGRASAAGSWLQPVAVARPRADGAVRVGLCGAELVIRGARAPRAALATAARDTIHLITLVD